jgi:protein-L-isoaspartate(D-aspartate) O-methyltransferase
MPDYTSQRLNMVESQVRTNDVTDVRIQEAMRQVPRERFVPAARQAMAYADAVVEVVPGRFLLDPRTFSKLAQLAQIASSDRILDVGCASGYSTAVLARLGADVVGVEEDAELVRVAAELLPAVGVRARVVQGRLTEGWAQGAPYDVIFVNGAVEEVPDKLLAQLAKYGRLVVILRKGPQGRAHIYVREHGRVGSRPDFDATVPVLAGFQKQKGFVF